MSSRTRERRLARKNGAPVEATADSAPAVYKTVKDALATGATRSQIVGKKGKYTIET